MSVEKDSKINELTIDTCNGLYATPQYSCLEVLLKIDGLSIIDNFENVLQAQCSEICKSHKAKLENLFPYLILGELQKERTRFPCNFSFCRNYDCRHMCSIRGNIRFTKERVIWDGFILRCYGVPGMSYNGDYPLSIDRYKFNIKDYFAELERCSQFLLSNEQVDELVVNSITIKILHNNEFKKFVVRSKNRTTWIYLNNDDSVVLEREADASVLILFLLAETKPGDSILFITQGIEWKYETADEDEVSYYGYVDGYHYGLNVPDYSDRYDSVDYKTVQVLSEPIFVDNVSLNICDNGRTNGFKFEIKNCDKEFYIGYECIRLTWCSDEKEYARDIATDTI